MLWNNRIYFKNDLIGSSVNLFFGDEKTLNEYFELKDEIVKKSKKVSEKIVDGVFNSFYDSRDCEVVFHKQISENKQTILYWIELNKFKWINNWENNLFNILKFQICE